LRGVCPQGERSESIPPLTAILKKELVRKYGLFFVYCPIHCRMAAQASYPAYREHSAIRHEYYYPA
ncbi:TPA: hypothetical protein ACIBH9_003147, partial [Salmonella enterica subsp. diarizonae serovar 61:l,v:z35]